MNGSKGRPTAPATGRVRVYQASADKLLAALPDRSIDLVITDPPYVSVNRGTSASSHLRDWFVDGLTWPQIARVLAIARRKLKPDGVLMAMTNNDGLRDAIGALERAGFIGIRTITWDRGYPGLGGGLRHQTEFVLVGRLPGSRTLAGVDLVSVAAVGPGTAGRYPTAKPDGLGRELAVISGIGPGSLVVDPFCGSGALLVGAAERGATVVAGDVSKRAVQQAGPRLAQASMARGRSRSGPASGQPRPIAAVTPVRPAQAAGSRRSTAGVTPVKPGKPNASGTSPAAVTPVRPAKPAGTRRSPATVTPVRPAKPTGTRAGTHRSTAGVRPVKPGQAAGTSRSPAAVTPVTPGQSRVIRRSTAGIRPVRPGQATVIRRSTAAVRPVRHGEPAATRRHVRQTRPRSRQ